MFYLVSEREQKTRLGQCDLAAIRALDTRILGCPTIIHQPDKALSGHSGTIGGQALDWV